MNVITFVSTHRKNKLQYSKVNQHENVPMNLVKLYKLRVQYLIFRVLIVRINIWFNKLKCFRWCLI